MSENISEDMSKEIPIDILEHMSDKNVKRYVRRNVTSNVRKYVKIERQKEC